MKNLPLVGIAALMSVVAGIIALTPSNDHAKALMSDHRPLSDSALACKGAPVEIVTISASAAYGVKDKNDKITWLKVRPLGDDYTVPCRISGDWTGEYRVGDKVAFQGDAG